MRLTLRISKQPTIPTENCWSKHSSCKEQRSQQISIWDTKGSRLWRQRRKCSRWVIIFWSPSPKQMRRKMRAVTVIMMKTSKRSRKSSQRILIIAPSLSCQNRSSNSTWLRALSSMIRWVRFSKKRPCTCRAPIGISHRIGRSARCPISTNQTNIRVTHTISRRRTFPFRKFIMRSHTRCKDTIQKVKHRRNGGAISRKDADLCTSTTQTSLCPCSASRTWGRLSQSTWTFSSTSQTTTLCWWKFIKRGESWSISRRIGNRCWPRPQSRQVSSSRGSKERWARRTLYMFGSRGLRDECFEGGRLVEDLSTFWTEILPKPLQPHFRPQLLHTNYYFKH